jgi:acyl-CoA synthetase (NDP forming)
VVPGTNLTAIKSLSEADSPVDLASISVPAPAVPEVLLDCIKHNVAGAQIHTSGFAETGEPEGIELQKKIVETARGKIRIVGPNCFGIHCPAGGITLLPGFDFSPDPGPCAMISQSGGLANDFGHEARLAGIGLSKIVSYGNGCDVEATELLDYLSDDDETRFIAAYIEGIRDGRGFLEVLKKTASRKPVVVWKGGLTPLGSRATLSHTGSMGGEAKIWDGALKQAKALPVEGLDAMTDTLSALVHLKKRSRTLALVGGGGAIGVFSSDLAHRFRLQVPEFSGETQKRLRKLLRTPGNSARNPLDTGTPLLPLEILKALISEVMTREPIDILVLIMLVHPIEVVSRAFMEMAGMPPFPPGSYLENLVDFLSSLKSQTGREVALVLENRTCRPEDGAIEPELRRLRLLFASRKIPVFPNAERALVGIRNAATFAAFS